MKIAPKYHRKARALDALALALVGILVALAGLLGLMLAPMAKASPATEAYADLYGTIVCSVLDEHPTIAGVIGVGQGISEESGFTLEQSGEVIGYSVVSYCPWHKPLMNRFITAFSSSESAGQIA